MKWNNSTMYGVIIGALSSFILSTGFAIADSTHPCPAGFQGKILERFVGRYVDGGDGNSFTYDASRRTPAHWMVSGKIMKFGKEYQFNLSSQDDTFYLEMSHPDASYRAFTGSVCGLQVTSPNSTKTVTQIRLASRQNSDIDHANVEHIYIDLSDDGGTLTRLSWGSSDEDYINNTSAVYPDAIFELKKVQ